MAIEPGKQFDSGDEDDWGEEEPSYFDDPNDIGIDKDEQDTMKWRAILGSHGDTGRPSSHITAAQITGPGAVEKAYANITTPAFYMQHRVNFQSLAGVGKIFDTFDENYHQSMEDAQEAHENGDTNTAIQHLMDAHNHLKKWHSDMSNFFGPHHPALRHVDDAIYNHEDSIASYAKAVE